MVKRLPNWLKIGVQAEFGPNFTVEFEAAIPKKFGLAYSVYCIAFYLEVLVNLRCNLPHHEKSLLFRENLHHSFEYLIFSLVS